MKKITQVLIFLFCATGFSQGIIDSAITEIKDFTIVVNGEAFVLPKWETPPIEQKENVRYNNVYITGEYVVGQGYDVWGERDFVATNGATIYFPEDMQKYDGRVFQIRNNGKDSKVMIPGYWTVKDSLGYVDYPGFTLTKRDYIGMLVSGDTINVMSYVTPLKGVIYQGKNAAGPDDLDSVGDIEPQDFSVKSIEVPGGYALEFERLVADGEKAAFAPIPMTGVVPGRAYNISLDFAKKGQSIDVRLFGLQWDRNEAIKKEGRITFKNVTPKEKDAPIFILGYVKGSVGEGGQVDNIVIEEAK